MPQARYVLSERAAAALRNLIAPGSGYGSRARRISDVGQSVGMQWRISTARTETQGEGEETPTVSVCVSVGPGIVAWGAGVNFANEGADPLGALAPGDSARVVWRTTAAPIPLVNDPRWPKGDAPECEDPECNCPERKGDPAGKGGDSGELLLVPGDWLAPEGTTDCREIGLVEVSASGVATVTQIQRDTIVALAVYGRAGGSEGGGGEKPDERDPPCGNPLNGGSDYNPLDHAEDNGSGERPDEGGGGGTGNPLDGEGEGGYTPTCSDLSGAA